MKLLRKIGRLFGKRKLDAEMSEEMRLHLERRVEENVASGMSSEDARYAALRKFGGVEQAKELAREERGFRWLDELAQDLRYALRQFSRAKGFTAVVVLTLALGIGSITAIYSVVDAIFLHPVPGPDSDRIVQIGQWVQYGNDPVRTPLGLSRPALAALENNRDLFEAVTWSDTISLERGGDDFATTIYGARVAVDFFSFLGARPSLGRGFGPGDVVALDDAGLPVGDATLVISHGWWQKAFGGDIGVLGRTIDLSGRRFTIVGVMPEYFQFPGGQFWLATEPERPRARSLGSVNLRFLARLKPEVTIEQTQAMLATVRQRLMQDYPPEDRSYGEYWRRAKAGLSFWVRPLRESIQDPTYVSAYEFQQMHRMLFGFLAALGFVLAIVCVNVANLTLARTEQRQQEFAIRAALGAGRRRLLRQCLVENLLLAVCGGMAGLVLTSWGIGIFGAFNQGPRLRPMEIDLRVLGIALAVSLGVGVIFGLVPAWTAGRGRLSGAMQGGRTTTSGRFGNWYRKGLVIAEVALAVVLLAGAGLMIRSVTRLLQVDAGFDPTNLIETRIGFVSSRAADAGEKRSALLGRLHERFSALPGVQQVGIFKNGYNREKVLLQGRTEPVLLIAAHVGWEESDFFRALGIPLRAGRYFTRADAVPGSLAVIVNETLAQLCWPGESAIGKTFRRSERRDMPEYEVAGVVADARTDSLAEADRPLFYLPIGAASLANGGEVLYVRTQQEPAGLVAAIRRELKSESSLMREPTLRVVQRMFYDSTRSQRTFRNYLAAFAGIGLFLAALGTYGVLAYFVTRRTREIGVRIALGAARWQVMELVMREGLLMIGLGVTAGLIATYWLTRLLQNQLFRVDAHDPAVLGVVVSVLAIIGVIACWLPARRAAKVDPMVALRAE